MDLINAELMYEFHARDLMHTEALRRYADHAVRDIKSNYGWDTDVQINIEPEAKDKHLFAVSMSVFGLGEPIVIKKAGKHVMTLLKKVRKAVTRRIQRVNGKRVAFRRRAPSKIKFAS